MFKKLKTAWHHRQLDRRFRREGIVAKNRKVEDSAIAAAAEKSRILGVFLLFLLWGVAALFLTFPCKSDVDSSLKAGDRALKNVYAETSFRYVGHIAMEEAKNKAKADSPDYYVVDAAATAAVRERFNAFFEAIQNYADQGKKTSSASADSGILQKKVAELSNEDLVIFSNFFNAGSGVSEFDRELDRLILSGIFSVNEKNKKSVGKKIVVIDRAHRRHIPRPVDDIPSVDKAAQILSEKISGRLSTRKIFAGLIGENGTLVYDAEASRLAAEAAAAEVKEIVNEVKQSSLIVAKDSVIDEATVEKYNAYIQQKQKSSITPGFLLRNIFIALIMVVFVGFYMYHIHPEIMRSNKKLALLGFVTIFSLFLNYGAIKLYIAAGEVFNLPPQYLLYFSPYTLASVILAVTLGFRVALYIGFFVASLLALMNGGGFEFAFLSMTACSLSALAVRGSANYRSFFFWTLLPVSLMGFICFLPNLNFDRLWEVMLTGIVISFVNGFLTSIAALMIIFFLELVFNVTTNMSLLLLINTHPLLERLKREAPGTFFHSMMVATLAEDAAKAIHANALRAKCGAMYHDIGKLSKPQYFTENNLENDNQHTDLNPQVSSMIIRDHVNEGLLLAKKYKLNRVIRNAIEQHHGKDLVHYFYNRAMHSDSKNGSHVDEVQFRYQGDLPKEKEMVIVSLADACEAAVRSLEKPSVQKIEIIIDEIFKKRFRDNQLDEAQMTLSELHKVRDSFVSNLTSMRHGRISYQQEENSTNEDENDLFMAAAKEQQTGESVKNKEIY